MTASARRPLKPCPKSCSLGPKQRHVRPALALMGALFAVLPASYAAAQTSGNQPSGTQPPRITRTAPPVPTAARQGAVIEVPAATEAQPAPASAPAATAEAPAPVAPAPTGEAAPNGRVESGLLECRGEMATAYGFGSSRGVTCEYRPAMGMNQYYTGTLSRVGLDFGVSDQASMIWMVLATTKQLGPGALAGEYVGFTSGAALGPGFSANVLMAKDATAGISLQPLSVSSDSGLSISIAAAGLTLVPSKAQRH